MNRKEEIAQRYCKGRSDGMDSSIRWVMEESKERRMRVRAGIFVSIFTALLVLLLYLIAVLVSDMFS